MQAMPGLLRRKKQMGMKWGSGFPEIQVLSLLNITELIVLNAPETGIEDMCLASEILARPQAKGIARGLSNPMESGLIFE